MLFSRAVHVVGIAGAILGLRRNLFLVRDRGNHDRVTALPDFFAKTRGPLFLRNTNSRTTAEVAAVAQENGWKVLYVIPDGVDADPEALLSVEAEGRYRIVTFSVNKG